MAVPMKPTKTVSSISGVPDVLNPGVLSVGALHAVLHAERSCAR